MVEDNESNTGRTTNYQFNIKKLGTRVSPDQRKQDPRKDISPVLRLMPMSKTPCMSPNKNNKKVLTFDKRSKAVPTIKQTPEEDIPVTQFGGGNIQNVKMSPLCENEAVIAKKKETL